MSSSAPGKPYKSNHRGWKYLSHHLKTTNLSSSSELEVCNSIIREALRNVANVFISDLYRIEVNEGGKPAKQSRVGGGGNLATGMGFIRFSLLRLFKKGERKNNKISPESPKHSSTPVEPFAPYSQQSDYYENGDRVELLSRYVVTKNEWLMILNTIPSSKLKPIMDRLRESIPHNSGEMMNVSQFLSDLAANSGIDLQLKESIVSLSINILLPEDIKKTIIDGLIQKTTPLPTLLDPRINEGYRTQMYKAIIALSEFDRKTLVKFTNPIDNVAGLLQVISQHLQAAHQPVDGLNYTELLPNLKEDEFKKSLNLLKQLIKNYDHVTDKIEKNKALMALMSAERAVVNQLSNKFPQIKYGSAIDTIYKANIIEAAARIESPEKQVNRLLNYIAAIVLTDTITWGFVCREISEYVYDIGFCASQLKLFLVPPRPDPSGKTRAEPSSIAVILKYEPWYYDLTTLPQATDEARVPQFETFWWGTKIDKIDQLRNAVFNLLQSIDDVFDRNKTAKVADIRKRELLQFDTTSGDMYVNLVNNSFVLRNEKQGETASTFRQLFTDSWNRFRLSALTSTESEFTLDRNMSTTAVYELCSYGESQSKFFTESGLVNQFASELLTTPVGGARSTRYVRLRSEVKKRGDLARRRRVYVDDAIGANYIKMNGEKVDLRSLKGKYVNA